MLTEEEFMNNFILKKFFIFKKVTHQVYNVSTDDVGLSSTQEEPFTIFLDRGFIKYKEVSIDLLGILI